MLNVDLLWQTLTSPIVVYVLLITGIWCFALAVTTPGSGLPEAGAIVFLGLAMMGLIRLPINLIGLCLIVISLVLYVLEIKWVSHGAFLIPGVITLAAGSFLLFPLEQALSPASLIVMTLMVLGTTGLFGLGLRKALEVRRRPVFQNPDAVVGTIGEARTDILRDGAVQVGDELWTAQAEELIPAGSRVQILRRSGLRLTVARIK
jgi:membrane-bound serine protease (ClpP class)